MMLLVWSWENKRGEWEQRRGTVFSGLGKVWRKCNVWLVLRLFIAEGSKDVDVVFYNGAKKFNRLFQRSLQALQNLMIKLA